MLCPINANSKTIELTMHTSCYCVKTNSAVKINQSRVDIKCRVQYALKNLSQNYQTGQKVFYDRVWMSSWLNGYHMFSMFCSQEKSDKMANEHGLNPSAKTKEPEMTKMPKWECIKCPACLMNIRDVYFGALVLALGPWPNENSWTKNM